jgi:hypothetical protein
VLECDEDGASEPAGGFLRIAHVNRRFRCVHPGERRGGGATFLSADEDPQVAYHYIRVGTQSGRKFQEFNIDFSVGRGGEELPDDIMLVQMLLRIVYFENEISGFPRLTDHEEEIKVNGHTPDLLMYRYIVHFKNQIIKKGVHLHPDKIFDPMRDNDPDKKSTISRTLYAFSRLQNLCANNAPERFGSFAEDETTPEMLRTALRQTRKTARKYSFVD